MLNVCTNLLFDLYFGTDELKPEWQFYRAWLIHLHNDINRYCMFSPHLTNSHQRPLVQIKISLIYKGKAEKK